jgi:ribulose 1,5-bisphosphate synthetase/thiazole synthase
MQTKLQKNIVVIGGGSAGVAAAVSAAQSGLEVALIERNPYLGGKATAAEVGTICGLYAFSKNETAQYVVEGFVKEFAEELKTRSHTQPLHNTMGMHYLPYDIEAYKNLCDSLLMKHKVTVLLNSSVTAVDVKNNTIQSITTTNGSDLYTIECETVIDCSGDGVVSQLTHLPLIKSDSYQAAAQVFTMQNVDSISEALLGMVLIKEIKKGIDSGLLESYYDRVYVVQGSVKNNEVSFKIGIPIEVTYTGSNSEDIKAKAQLMAKTLAAFFVEHIPVFKNAALHHIAPEVGFRVGIRAIGNYILTEEDVLECKKYNTSIANGAWPIEEWGQDKRVHMRYFEENNYYQIPADCLTSKTLSNLFFAGRIISATDAAIASARVMGICLQTGYAAGKLAVGYCSKTPVNQAITMIQKELKLNH